jgi:hypothetical protein
MPSKIPPYGGAFSGVAGVADAVAVVVVDADADAGAGAGKKQKMAIDRRYSFFISR